MSDRDRSPRRAMCAAVLVMEAIALGLTAPVMIQLSDVSTGVALGVALGPAAACVVVAGLLRAEWGYLLGHVLQVVAIALGFVLTPIFILGALFAALWASAYLLGRKIEREKAAAYAEWDRQQAQDSAQDSGD